MIKLDRNNTLAEQHFILVKELLQKRITKILRIGFIKKKSIHLQLSIGLRSYLEEIQNDTSLKELILSDPADLENTIKGIEKKHPSFIIPNSKENLILRNIFISSGYDNKVFCKHQFIKNINIDTCPYCNRNYIYYLSKSSQIKPQIDHFFPKSIYPFFALTYYNLIPSCQTCNGFGAKEEKKPTDEKLVNPYLIENNNLRFSYKIKSIDFITPLQNKDSIEVFFEDKDSMSGNIDVFKLKDLYAQHTDHVLELIVKSKISYSTKYREYLNSYSKLKFDQNEIDRMILGNFSRVEEIHKRPLAKLYIDIGKELNLIK